jgi:hypothetical protein
MQFHRHQHPLHLNPTRESKLIIVEAVTWPVFYIRFLGCLELFSNSHRASSENVALELAYIPTVQPPT